MTLNIGMLSLNMKFQWSNKNNSNTRKNYFLCKQKSNQRQKLPWNTFANLIIKLVTSHMIIILKYHTKMYNFFFYVFFVLAHFFLFFFKFVTYFKVLWLGFNFSAYKLHQKVEKIPFAMIWFIRVVSECKHLPP